MPPYPEGSTLGTVGSGLPGTAGPVLGQRGRGGRGGRGRPKVGGGAGRHRSGPRGLLPDREFPVRRSPAERGRGVRRRGGRRRATGAGGAAAVAAAGPLLRGRGGGRTAYACGAAEPARARASNDGRRPRPGRCGTRRPAVGLGRLTTVAGPVALARPPACPAAARVTVAPGPSGDAVAEGAPEPGLIVCRSPRAEPVLAPGRGGGPGVRARHRVPQPGRQLVAISSSARV